MAGEQVAPNGPDADQPSITNGADDGPSRRFGEDILLRNFDTEADHEVTVTVTVTDTDESTTGAGQVEFESTYTVAPDETVCEMDALPTGTYDVTVGMDDRKQTTGTVHIDSHPLNRILIEFGNGIVSLADGGY